MRDILHVHLVCPAGITENMLSRRPPWIHVEETWASLVFGLGGATAPVRVGIPFVYFVPFWFISMCSIVAVILVLWVPVFLGALLRHLVGWALSRPLRPWWVGRVLLPLRVSGEPRVV